MVRIPPMNVTPDCPRCHLPLPQIPVGIKSQRVERGELVLTLEADPDGTWYARTRAAHPWCFGEKDDAPTEIAA